MIKIKNLVLKHSQRKLICGLNASIGINETVAVIGSDAEAKKMLLRSIAMLEPEVSGEIIIDETNMLRKNTNRSAVRHKIAYIGKETELFSNMTVRDNIALAPRRRMHFAKRRAENLADSMIELVGIGECTELYPYELKKSEKERAVIARALAVNPEILLFDDTDFSAETKALIRKLASENITVVISTGDIEFARNTAERIMLMENGVICEYGTPEEVIDSPHTPEAKEFFRAEKTVSYYIDSKAFDRYRLFIKIDKFGRENSVSNEICERIKSTLEEIVLNRLMPHYECETGINVEIRTSEGKPRAVMLLEYEGEQYNPFDSVKEANEPEMINISGYLNAQEYDYENEVNRLVLGFKQK